LSIACINGAGKPILTANSFKYALSISRIARIGGAHAIVITNHINIIASCGGRAIIKCACFIVGADYWGVDTCPIRTA
jgi:hypothetical protein